VGAARLTYTLESVEPPTSEAIDKAVAVWRSAGLDAS
jgi:hypothetical protein